MIQTYNNYFCILKVEQSHGVIWKLSMMQEAAIQRWMHKNNEGPRMQKYACNIVYHEVIQNHTK